jgi:hypothetical protein
MAEFESYTIRTQLERLKNLRASQSQVREVQTEMADLRTNLKRNGFSDEEIDIRTA